MATYAENYHDIQARPIDKSKNKAWKSYSRGDRLHGPIWRQPPLQNVRYLPTPSSGFVEAFWTRALLSMVTGNQMSSKSSRGALLHGICNGPTETQV